MGTTYTLLFETGEGDGYWKLEERADGVICTTSNAETRQPVTPQAYRGWAADEFRSGLERDGVPAGVIERVLEQAGLA